MEVISLAEVVGDATAPDGATHMVYAYRQGDWCGYGEAVAWGNGSLYRAKLGHCSCYGPFDDNNWVKVSPGDLRDYLTYHCRGYDPEASCVGQEDEETAYLLLRWLTDNGVLEDVKCG